MKSLIRTTSVLAIAILAAGSLALAEDTVQGRRVIERQESTVEAEEPLVVALRTMSIATGTGSQYGGGRVLVIPTEETSVKELLAITEDLNIMSRILDKRLEEADLGRDYDLFYGTNFLEWNLPVTKCIYLDGYGVLFMKKVDFPLSPPVEPNAIEKITEDIDPVWVRTRQEMYFRKDLLKPRRRRKSKEQYDANKIQTLKETLIRTLRHAANIRNLEPEDWVVLTVIGESEHLEISGLGMAVSHECVHCHGSEASSTLLAAVGPDREQPVPECPLEGARSFSPAVMIIRVRKSEVDAFAQDELDFHQFGEEVQILTY
jgi:hypothetical protein